jgi:hypothetical protein
MYTLTLEFNPVTNTQAVDALVFALSIHLWLDHKIESAQPEYNVLEFTSAAHCTLAQLVLSGDSRYTVRRMAS